MGPGPGATTLKLEGADFTPVTAKSLVKDGGLDGILEKIEGISALEDPLLALGATKSTMPATSKAAASKRGGKPLSIPNLVSVSTLASPEDEHEIGDTGGARIVIRANKAEVRLENVTLPMWIAANSRIMQELVTTGKLSGTSSISDYLSYTVKFAELFEIHTLSVVVYDNESCSINTVFGGEATLNFCILALSSNAELWVLPNQHRQNS